MEVAAAGYLVLIGFGVFAVHDFNGKSVTDFLAGIAVFLWLALIPLVFFPVWKEVRRRYRLVDEMDRRFRRYREAAEVDRVAS
jgi:hypothetical protein